jgi:hypothetical protein
MPLFLGGFFKKGRGKKEVGKAFIEFRFNEIWKVRMQMICV